MTTFNIETEIRLLRQPTGAIRLGDYLLEQLADSGWTQFRAAVAFLKRSGLKHIAPALVDFSQRATVKISVGIDCRGTSVEGLKDLMNCLQTHGEIYIFHNENVSTFHPKVYLFSNDSHATIAIGSGNVTEGGLYTNYEAGLVLSLNLENSADQQFLIAVESILDEWADVSSGICKLLTPALLTDLQQSGYILEESRMESTDAEEATLATGLRGQRSQVEQHTLFSRVPVPRAPRSTAVAATSQEVVPATTIVPTVSEGVTGFVMTLQRTDVGTGQTSPGTSRRSPEIFVPLVARDHFPEFWGWPAMFTADPNRPGKMDRRDVLMRLGTEIIEVNMMTWPDKHDFRLRNERLRSAGSVGDILRIERTVDISEFQYYVEVIPIGTSQYQNYLRICTNSVRNSEKQWGYYV